MVHGCSLYLRSAKKFPCKCCSLLFDACFGPYQQITIFLFFFFSSYVHYLLYSITNSTFM
ncbi:hypothetical protein RchiOBHm_Chr7g0205691 [Rosa chinensis]|uniref:Uncharacterized protein n=1 Tax=Rosa chinensis TaxID=74649 RepID=A0A2P6P903_ROSCH|nr:hypothetical protein RchiOBHm_Chr7g0205691 [Rosa chinensis]